MLLSFWTIFLFTSAMRHLFTRAWLRSGGFTSSRTAARRGRQHQVDIDKEGKGEEGRTGEAASGAVEEALDDVLDLAAQVRVAAAELERERVRDALGEQAALSLLFRAEFGLPRFLLEHCLRGA